MTLPSTLDVLLPFWGMAGGVIKVLDYAEHAAQLDIETTLWAPPRPDPGDTVFTLPVIERLNTHSSVSLRGLDDLEFDDDATVLFTEVGHHRLIEAAMDRPLGDRLIHLVQGTRHANARWNGGANYRLLHRPMTRIAVSTAVADAIEPLVNPNGRTVTIREGHDWPFFAKDVPASPVPASHRLRILYTTWKTDLGERIARRLDDSPVHDDVACISVSTPLGWPALRNRYHGADVFICTPGPEEGFYLPGLEAMAAGAAVITSLVGGNAEYVRDGENAIVVPYDDVDAHVQAIERLVTDRSLLNRLTQGPATEVLSNHSLADERMAFADVLREVNREPASAVGYDLEHGAAHR